MLAMLFSKESVIWNNSPEVIGRNLETRPTDLTLSNEPDSASPPDPCFKIRREPGLIFRKASGSLPEA